MITHTRILTTTNTNPHLNLAMEDALLHARPEGQALLFLWQNKHTVVIGAGQNAWRECRTQLLLDEQGTLARRSSGGGAVYHDMGNLNFSFIMPRDDYDVARQLRVVCEAVRSFGIDAVPSGRNDILAAGRKFSGNAFRVLKQSALHHGTLLVDVDMQKLGRYLNVDAKKMAMKGVKSVPARVINLNELAPVTIPALHDALIQAFKQAYGDAEIETPRFETIEGYERLRPRYESWAHNYGESPAGEINLSERFDWGGLECSLQIKNGKIQSAQVYTDAMDEGLHQRLAAALDDCAFAPKDMAACAANIGLDDVAAYFQTIDI